MAADVEQLGWGGPTTQGDIRVMRSVTRLLCAAAIVSVCSAGVGAQGSAPPPTATEQTTTSDHVFDLGEIVVVGAREGETGVGGATVTGEQIRRFERLTLDQAVNLAPGVVSTLDGNGRRNESDIFVRGFGRLQVPLLVDGVRIYLPADNRLDFGRFLTADIAAVQIRKGYASVLDGPGAMGGAINLVTRKPVQTFESEAAISLGGRTENETWNGYAMAGSRQRLFYVQASTSVVDRDFFTLSGDYSPVTGSLQPAGARLQSDSRDWRINLKTGYTPNDDDEYTFNYTKQNGEKGAPLNVYNSPPVPANGFWRWPYWDLQNTSFLSNTRLGSKAYVKGKAYYNTFSNGLDAYDDITYTTQSAMGRFSSPYDDHAYGVNVEIGTERPAGNAIKAALFYRKDFHQEQQTTRPTNQTLSSQEPPQDQAQYTWSAALEDTYRIADTVDLVGGVSVEKYAITRAEEFNAARGLFEYPRGQSDSLNWQSALVWRYAASSEAHVSISDRGRFPTIFELYSTRFGTATPNPDLGPERATNVEVGWKGRWPRAVRLEGALFYSDVRDLIQTVVLLDTTTQTQNVGDGEFYGAEVAADGQVLPTLGVGGNYTYTHRTITDALLPDLQATGVPRHKALLYASWRPIERVTVTPDLQLASERWSDRNPPAPSAYVQTGSFALFDVSGEVALSRSVGVTAGFKNLFDENYELAWGFPQPGRTFYVKARFGL